MPPSPRARTTSLATRTVGSSPSRSAGACSRPVSASRCWHCSIRTRRAFASRSVAGRCARPRTSPRTIWRTSWRSPGRCPTAPRRPRAAAGPAPAPRRPRGPDRRAPALSRSLAADGRAPAPRRARGADGRAPRPRPRPPSPLGTHRARRPARWRRSTASRSSGLRRVARGTSRASGKLGWRRHARQAVEVRPVPGTHGTMLRDPHVSYLGSELARCLADARRGACEPQGAADPPAAPRSA